MDGNIQVTEEFYIFVEFCFKHGGTLRNHKQFGEMARVLKQKISDMHERLLTQRAPDRGRSRLSLITLNKFMVLRSRPCG